ncbi:hypothetical protein LWP59_18475 [Amycolatopsis acidiphila]|uniref:Uncharacterized protein n=1 Tax=Amycolatopsis acidiphila TaxID=715473 RepID=A0A558A6W9_9PSEU|nr:hypothetical protein [Amycolatopsis acidiphila]TVT20007.1 hypothetical protein FNH06_22060 [Amycolatopsis acidiphila]UIJ63470.1 hypothetical protein LWP59_18475 [Amycolatopsis acidiphila]GHG68745.1 hypothetical protein GCM10017788_28760 [Amycolatopsis acidiphila]
MWTKHDRLAVAGRYQAAIGSGVDPAALVDVISQAQAERAAAKAELGNAPKGTAVSEAEVYAMTDSLGDLGTMLTEAKPVALERLYRALNLQLRYAPKELAVYATTSPRVGGVRVRGGDVCTNHTASPALGRFTVEVVPVRTCCAVEPESMTASCEPDIPADVAGKCPRHRPRMPPHTLG